MTDTASENKANQFYAAETSKHKALKAAGGLAGDKTLRDEFAGLAMVTIMPDSRVDSYKHAADESYRMADAMLEARKTPTEDDA